MLYIRYGTPGFRNTEQVKGCTVNPKYVVTDPMVEGLAWET